VKIKTEKILQFKILTTSKFEWAILTHGSGNEAMVGGADSETEHQHLHRPFCPVNYLD